MIIFFLRSTFQVSRLFSIFLVFSFSSIYSQAQDNAQNDQKKAGILALIQVESTTLDGKPLSGPDVLFTHENIRHLKVTIQALALKGKDKRGSLAYKYYKPNNLLYSQEGPKHGFSHLWPAVLLGENQFFTKVLIEGPLSSYALGLHKIEVFWLPEGSSEWLFLSSMSFQVSM